jgi:hypothetical protein
MSDWRNEKRVCACGNGFQPKREGQRHCCAGCRVKQAKARYRSDTQNQGRLIIVARSDTSPTMGQSEAPQWANWPICPVCKLWRMLPRDGLPRHLFCIALRKAKLQTPLLAEAA